jgi:hypothetical protein
MCERKAASGSATLAEVYDGRLSLFLCDIYVPISRFGWILGVAQSCAHSKMSMMQGSKYRLLAAITSMMVLGTAAHAQTPLCTLEVPGTTIWSPGGRRTNAPYTGTVKTTFVQKLPDGNSIHGVLISHEARDSAGRTMSQTVQGCSFGEDGQRHERLMTRVDDPIARTTANWNSGNAGEQKLVRVTHLDVPQPTMKLTPEELAPLANRQKAFEAAMSYFQKGYKSEDLGAKQIKGIAALGSRLTRTIAAGEEGNDKPITVVTETWRSTDLAMTLYAAQDDPRRGRITMELRDLEMGEPDPALFAPPSGYKVIENLAP